MHKIKVDMKNRWLTGETVLSIAKRYSTTERNVYYHIQPLTAREKGLHTQNVELKRQLAKKKGGENGKKVKGQKDNGQNSKAGSEKHPEGQAGQGPQGAGTQARPNLSDFIE